MPNSEILFTYRLAAVFKLIGVITAVGVGYITIWEFGPTFYRWWSAGFSAIILLVLLAPWWDWLPVNNPEKLAHSLLIIGLGIGLISPNAELLHSVFQPYQDLYAFPQFVEILKFTPDQVNNIHGFGQMFIIVPVIVATWQYRLKGMLWVMPIAGISYVLVAFLMPIDAFNWYFYAVRGFVLLGICLVVGLVTWMLVDMMRAEQEKLSIANQKLAEQALMMEELAASRERNRLARELHDTLAHSISGATIQLQAVQTLIKVNSDEAVVELKDAQKHLKDGLAESRRAIAMLRDSALERLGLPKALEFEATKIAERSELNVDIQITEEMGLPELTEQAVFRIISSAMNNVERHANASQMSLHISRTSSSCTFQVSDDGKGFLVDAAPRDGRFGLIGMHERAELIGAELQIESQLNLGTHVTLIVPT